MSAALDRLVADMGERVASRLGDPDIHEDTMVFRVLLEAAAYRLNLPFEAFALPHNAKYVECLASHLGALLQDIDLLGEEI